MKRFAAYLLVLLALPALLLVPAAAAGAPAAAPAAPTTLVVNGRTLDLQGLPRALYWENSSVMIPLRKTAEALGETVTWDSDLRAARVEDSVQSALLRDRSASVEWTGKLQVINLSRTTDLPAPAVIWSGYTYVPASFFEELFNTVTVSGTTVTVAPIVYTLDDGAAA
jgi:hypothetical protein